MSDEKIPDLLSLSPAMAERAWRNHLADLEEPPTGDLATLAAYVGLSIKEWRMNVGRDGEEVLCKNLGERLAAYTAARKLTAD